MPNLKIFKRKNSKQNQVALIRHGIYDSDVEIFRAGSFTMSYLSQVRAGDAFRKLPQERWFQARGAVTVVPNSKDPDNPTLIMPGVEVLQAKPIAVEKPTKVAAEVLTGPTVGEVYRALANQSPRTGNGDIIPPSTTAKSVPRCDSGEDVEDVDFRE